MSEAKKEHPYNVLKSPFRELEQRGITLENWLDHLDEMTDEEITPMLNLAVKNRLPHLEEERKASPDISDRRRAEIMRGFVI